jgi:hypothetical protein
LRRRGWKDAVICLPHDGVATNNITGKRYIDHWREAGFECVEFCSHAKNAEDDPLQQLFRLLFCQRQTKVPADTRLSGRSWQSRIRKKICPLSSVRGTPWLNKKYDFRYHYFTHSHHEKAFDMSAAQSKRSNAAKSPT